MCVYVPTQVDASNANDEDAVVGIDQIAPIVQVLPKDDKDAHAAVAVDQTRSPLPAVFDENPPKRQKIEIHPADLAVEAAHVKIYRSMYYKEGLCLKSCAYICFKTWIWIATDTHDIHNHTRGNRIGIREIHGKKKQLISFGGKDKLQKEELITIANMLIDELESKTLSLADLPDRAKLLVSEWPAPEEIAWGGPSLYCGNIYMHTICLQPPREESGEWNIIYE
jgi:hypothetical protein